jgi:hypothetical protein
MDRSYITENAQERERLRKLVSRMTDEDLKLQIYQEGWTIAVVLAHLAFWDQRALVLMRQWKKTGVVPSRIDTNSTNDSLLPFFQAIHPRECAKLAVSCAESIDIAIEQASPEFIADIERLGDQHRLNRHIHRKMHLDEIQTLWQAKRHDSII